MSIAATWLVMKIVAGADRYPPRSELVEAHDILQAVANYYEEYGELPLVDGGVALAKLTEANPRRITFLEGGSRVADEAGRLLNRFGHPYLFAASGDMIHLVSLHTPDAGHGLRNTPMFSGSLVYQRRMPAPRRGP